jgi:threonyl-tRNA synthetase
VEKEISIAEKCDRKSKRLEELVVLFTCVEKGDTPQVAHKAVDGIKEYLETIKGCRVLIYPYAHLSNNLANPADALNILKEMEGYSKTQGIETYRAPFGWCKEFSISIKGHPLAEQLRTVVSGEEGEEAKVVSKALEVEEKIKSYWYILQHDGNLVPLDEFNFTGQENLKKFADYEITKSREVKKVPPHVNLMRRLELVDYEPATDAGNFRWYPKGRLIKSLLERYVTEKVIAYGGMEVETPIMYNLEHPSLSSYLHRFPARQYTLKSDDKEFFLRFSACFGQFLMAHDAQISYKQLPFKIYELTRYSFRREKSGELTGLRRLRGFTMPDVHALCADMNQAKKEFLKRFQLSMDTLKGLELNPEEYELAIRFTKDFYEENKDFIVSLHRLFDKPALIEMWDERFFYYVLKWEFNFVDNLDKASALSTDQIDIENAERYGITYIDEKGEKQYPLILHCSPSGGIERDLYAMLEKAYMEQEKGKAPSLPLWLSPTQVRIIPVTDQFLAEAEKLCIKISKQNVRADWDDRSLTMQRKVREAETEWVPYIVVMGQREVDSGVLAVRDRRLSKAGKAGKVRQMKMDELVAEIKDRTSGKPFQQLPLPIELSKRPRFYG